MSTIKSQQEILDKLKIETLNPMQQAAAQAIGKSSQVVLLSPTGTGKTLAFALPVIQSLDPEEAEVQVLILVPTRELAIQIEQVFREMGTGFKVNAVYGGRAGSKDKEDLKHKPAILIGTPGRVADRFRRDEWTRDAIHTLVLDEFDKSLEIGFEKEMKEIISELRGLRKKVLTSATQGIKIPEWVRLKNPEYVNFLEGHESRLELKKVVSPTKDKLDSLATLLAHLDQDNGIVFCNFKDSIDFVSNHLLKIGVDHGCFHGGMEQIDRERTLVKFRNGTIKLIVATDLAARGLDIPELKYIIHYQLPSRQEEFTHRNGRTARMNSNGTAYIFQHGDDPLPEFIPEVPEQKLKPKSTYSRPAWSTVYISGGRKDKISKGDIAGMLMKQGGLTKEQVGIIEIKQDFSFVAVAAEVAGKLIKALDNTKIKTKKVRFTLLR